ncbi:hypothetical protein Fbal_2027 [Ferrimonas balearica DSM 9799]|uniref:Uncharacterized protein n=1 Tax=Ferrimonas balearica (strain DSM 9799 / CCM 4581 / KCTC 23876 / PAT) TaxID=550540 RepID=E1SU97_FERBD|nr:hypothetical protein [Ferrimonas balearica]ADN76230.1 hypothetical protein Fbal_2027 [Ferrimonas balearica DSM 9799]
MSIDPVDIGLRLRAPISQLNPLITSVATDHFTVVELRSCHHHRCHACLVSLPKSVATNGLDASILLMNRVMQLMEKGAAQWQMSETRRDRIIGYWCTGFSAGKLGHPTVAEMTKRLDELLLIISSAGLSTQACVVCRPKFSIKINGRKMDVSEAAPYLKPPTVEAAMALNFHHNEVDVLFETQHSYGLFCWFTPSASGADPTR